MDILAISGLSLVLLFLVLILLKRDKQVRDFLLITFLLLIGADLLYRYFNISSVNEKKHWL